MVNPSGSLQRFVDTATGSQMPGAA